MATVLSFPTERCGEGKQQADQKTGEIIIFPGVRIERGEFCLADRLATANVKNRAKSVQMALADD